MWLPRDSAAWLNRYPVAYGAKVEN